MSSGDANQNSSIGEEKTEAFNLFDGLTSDSICSSPLPTPPENGNLPGPMKQPWLILKLGPYAVLAHSYVDEHQSRFTEQVLKLLMWLNDHSRLGKDAYLEVGQDGLLAWSSIYNKYCSLMPTDEELFFDDHVLRNYVNWYRKMKSKSSLPNCDEIVQEFLSMMGLSGINNFTILVKLSNARHSRKLCQYGYEWVRWVLDLTISVLLKKVTLCFLEEKGLTQNKIMLKAIKSLDMSVRNEWHFLRTDKNLEGRDRIFDYLDNNKNFGPCIPNIFTQ